MEISPPAEGAPFFGQDAQFAGISFDLTDNGDGTVTDLSSGLMWEQKDSGRGMDWEDALAYAESVTTAGYDDRRLPNIKEPQSIVNYGHSPSASDAANSGPAIDTDYFEITGLAAGTTNYDPDYGYFWSSTRAQFNPMPPLLLWLVCSVRYGRRSRQRRPAWRRRRPVRHQVRRGALGEGGERYYNFVRCVRDAD